MKLLETFILSILLCPAISFADEVDDLRAVLDPIMYRVRGVTGSGIGACIKGTDLDPLPYLAQSTKEIPIDLCLVYSVKTEDQIPYVRSQYKKLRVSSRVAVRFEKELPPMIEQ